MSPRPNNLLALPTVSKLLCVSHAFWYVSSGAAMFGDWPIERIRTDPWESRRSASPGFACAGAPCVKAGTDAATATEMDQSSSMCLIIVRSGTNNMSRAEPSSVTTS